VSALSVLDECWPRIATGIDSSWFAAPASPDSTPYTHVHRNGYGFEARPAVEPYGVLILTAADKLLNAGPFCSLSALCGLMLVGVSGLYVLAALRLCVVAYKFICPFLLSHRGPAHFSAFFFWPPPTTSIAIPPHFCCLALTGGHQMHSARPATPPGRPDCRRRYKRKKDKK